MAEYDLSPQGALYEKLQASGYAGRATPLLGRVRRSLLLIILQVVKNDNNVKTVCATSQTLRFLVQPERGGFKRLRRGF